MHPTAVSFVIDSLEFSLCAFTQLLSNWPQLTTPKFLTWPCSLRILRSFDHFSFFIPIVSILFDLVLPRQFQNNEGLCYPFFPPVFGIFLHLDPPIPTSLHLLSNLGLTSSKYRQSLWKQKCVPKLKWSEIKWDCMLVSKLQLESQQLHL